MVHSIDLSDQEAARFIGKGGIYANVIGQEPRWFIRSAPDIGEGACHLVVDSDKEEDIQRMSALVTSASQGGFFRVPFRVEGEVRTERLLREIEMETNTKIYMQMRHDIQTIVVLVGPGNNGVLGLVWDAVRRIRKLQSTPPRQSRTKGTKGRSVQEGRLREAAHRNNLEAVEPPTETQADIPVADEIRRDEAEQGQQQWTLLHDAAHENDVEAVRFLLVEVKAPARVSDRNGWTPLHCAAKHDNLELVKFLVRRKASLTAQTSEGQMPVDIARVHNHSKVVEYLEQKARSERSLEKESSFEIAMEKAYKDSLEDK